MIKFFHKALFSLLAISIIIVFVVLVIGGIIKYQEWLIIEETKGPEETPNRVVVTEATTLLDNLKKETKIDFLELEPIQFDWMTEGGKEVIVGKGLEAVEISREQAEKIYKFFENRGFEVDPYNVSGGTIVGLLGYKKDQIVCIVIEGAAGYKEATDQWVPPEPDRSDVEVKCGLLTKSSGLANPAVVYCVNQGGLVIPVETSGGIAGYCALPDGRTCEEWQLFYSEGQECLPLEQ